MTKAKAKENIENSKIKKRIYKGSPLRFTVDISNETLWATRTRRNIVQDLMK